MAWRASAAGAALICWRTEAGGQTQPLANCGYVTGAEWRRDRAWALRSRGVAAGVGRAGWAPPQAEAGAEGGGVPAGEQQAPIDRWLREPIRVGRRPQVPKSRRWQQQQSGSCPLRITPIAPQRTRRNDDVQRVPLCRGLWRCLIPYTIEGSSGTLVAAESQLLAPTAILSLASAMPRRISEAASFSTPLRTPQAQFAAKPNNSLQHDRFQCRDDRQQAFLRTYSEPLFCRLNVQLSTFSF